MRKQLISFAQVIKFCKISSSRRDFNPKPPPCLTPIGISVREGILLVGGKIALNITICSKNEQSTLKLTF